MKECKPLGVGRAVAAAGVVYDGLLVGERWIVSLTLPAAVGISWVRWCRLTVSKPVLKVPMVSELETKMW